MYLILACRDASLQIPILYIYFPLFCKLLMNLKKNLDIFCVYIHTYIFTISKEVTEIKANMSLWGIIIISSVPPDTLNNWWTLVVKVEFLFVLSLRSTRYVYSKKLFMQVGRFLTFLNKRFSLNKNDPSLRKSSLRNQYN